MESIRGGVSHPTLLGVLLFLPDKDNRPNVVKRSGEVGGD